MNITSWLILVAMIVVGFVSVFVDLTKTGKSRRNRLYACAVVFMLLALASGTYGWSRFGAADPQELGGWFVLLALNALIGAVLYGYSNGPESFPPI